MDRDAARVWPRFWLWTAAMLALAVFYALRVAPGLRIDTDILALLPGAPAATSAAQQRHAGALSQKLVFLVGAADAGHARAVAGELAERLRAAPGFAQVTAHMGAAAMDLGMYRAHRYDLLADAHRQLLLQGHGAALYARAAASLYGPGLNARVLPVAEDPLNLLGAFVTQLATGPGGARLENGMLMVGAGDTQYVVIGAELAGDPFADATQDQVIPAIDAAREQARAAGTQLLASGVILHAAHAARRARAEITVVGTVSMVGVSLMLVLTFRSLRPLLLNALTLGSGALAALTVCQLVFGRVTLIALVFGSGLVGVAADYSTHFLADQFRRDAGWTPRQALRHVGPGIAVGMGCAVLGYLSLGLTPLPGLRQMAVFSATGLVVACCGVLCWYPVLAPPARRGEPLPLRWAMRLDRRLGRGPGRRKQIAAGVLAVLALAGLARVRFADDVRLLHAPPATLAATDARVRELLGSLPDSQYFLVHGRSGQAVLRAEEQLRAGLDPLVADGSLAGYRAVTQALPSVQRQLENRALLAAQVYAPDGIATRLMAELGFPPELAARQRAALAAAGPPLRVAPWLADDASRPFRDLWLGADAHGHAAVVSLNGIRDLAALRTLAAGVPGVVFVDQVAAVSDLLGHYRRLALVLLAAAYALIGVAMAVRYGPADAARLLAVPLGAALGTLTLLGAGGALHLFHVLGLFVVLGLGVDYAVFLREGAAARGATVLAISLSTFGAVLSYGLLAFSATPFVRAIGLTVLLGVALTYLLALLVQRPTGVPAPRAEPG